MKHLFIPERDWESEEDPPHEAVTRSGTRPVTRSQVRPSNSVSTPSEPSTPSQSRSSNLAGPSGAVQGIDLDFVDPEVTTSSEVDQSQPSADIEEERDPTPEELAQARAGKGKGKGRRPASTSD